MTKPIKVVVHGGLGNQLYQLFVAKIIAYENPGCPIIFFEKFLSAYSVARQFELEAIFHNANRNEHHDFILKMRCPKILSRITSSKDYVFNIPFYGYIVDGYFQSKSDYDSYSQEALKSALNEIREMAKLKYILTQRKSKIRHLRLTDFFQDEAHARVFVKNCIENLDGDVDFITDQEELLSMELANSKLRFNCNVISTSKLTAWELIRLMSEYKSIETNGSTLPFWAAILSNSKLETTNPKHRELWDYLACL